MRPNRPCGSGDDIANGASPPTKLMISHPAPPMTTAVAAAAHTGYAGRPRCASRADNTR